MPVGPLPTFVIAVLKPYAGVVPQSNHAPVICPSGLTVPLSVANVDLTGLARNEMSRGNPSGAPVATQLGAFVPGPKIPLWRLAVASKFVVPVPSSIR